MLSSIFESICWSKFLPRRPKPVIERYLLKLCLVLKERFQNFENKSFLWFSSLKSQICSKKLVSPQAAQAGQCLRSLTRKERENSSIQGNRTHALIARRCALYCCCARSRKAIGIQPVAVRSRNPGPGFRTGRW